MNKCHNYLSKRIADSTNEHRITTQLENDFQDGIENDKTDLKNIEVKQDTMRRNGIDLEERVNLITEEFVEMKTRMAIYEKSRIQSYDLKRILNQKSRKKNLVQSF